MSVRENLTKAKAMIEPREKWCQGTFAKDKDGAPVSVADPTACCYCTVGAVGAVLGIPLAPTGTAVLPREYSELLDNAAVEVAKAHLPGNPSYIEFIMAVEVNDGEAGLTIEAHEAAMKMLDVAIARAPN